MNGGLTARGATGLFVWSDGENQQIPPKSVGGTTVPGASPLMNFANLHVLCGATNADYIEILVPEEGYDYALKTYLAPDAEGFVRPPEAPGIGVNIDWEYIAANKKFELTT